MGVSTAKSAVAERKRHAAVYLQRKRDHQCVYCGNDHEKGWKKVACTACEKKRSKSRRTSRRVQTEASAIALGFCRYHRQREAVVGTTMCRDCLDTKSAWTIEWRRQKRAEAIKKGKCSHCFKKKPRPGYLRCETCIKKDEAQKAKSKKKVAVVLPKWKCTACKRRRVVGKEKTCRTCQEKARIHYAKRRDAQVWAVWFLMRLKAAAQEIVMPLQKAS